MKLEYIWLDGHETPGIRSKTRYDVFDFGSEQEPAPLDNVFTQIPEWSFDGSSTNQADIDSSDLVLRPVRMYPNPMENGREQISYIVLCEVFGSDGSPHESNVRYDLREYLNTEDDLGLMTSVEQEYVLWDSIPDWPTGWGWDNKEDEGMHPEDAGKSYCGIGSGNITQKWVSDSHVQACMRAGIRIAGTNAEVMKSQWEYQLFPSDPLVCADSLWISRYILERIAEQRNISINYDPKPFKEYNGSGGHINFSTRDMREEGGEELFNNIIAALEENHNKTIESYGKDNKKRLTGKHETSKYNKFTSGISDRSASVRIPLDTTRNWKGHIEDRRPAANIDPYAALLALCKVVNSVTAGVLV